MIYDLNALYRAAKSEAKHRDEVYSRFLSGSHPDAERIFNFHNGVVRDLVRDYAAHGGDNRAVSVSVRFDLQGEDRVDVSGGKPKHHSRRQGDDPEEDALHDAVISSPGRKTFQRCSAISGLVSTIIAVSNALTSPRYILLIAQSLSLWNAFSQN